MQTHIQGNKTREAHLAILENASTKNDKDDIPNQIKFDKDFVSKNDTKLDVTKKLMSLMLFEKAALVNIKQDRTKLRQFPTQDKFGQITITAGAKA